MPSTPKDYTTLSARVPRALAEAVTRYTSQHRASLSELIREGLELRLDADVPGRSHGKSSDPGGEVLHEVLQVLNTMAPKLHVVVRETITEVLHEGIPRNASTQEPNRKGHTSVIPTEIPVSPPIRHGITEVVHTDTQEQTPADEVVHEVLPHDATVQRWVAAPALHTEALEADQSQDHARTKTEAKAAPSLPPFESFDTERYYLGKLCPQGHQYLHSGHSLKRRAKRDCLVCHREASARSRREQRRPAQI